ncbi:MAG: lamin tail domain-containing protein [Deltaproteobacteria bacterium]|nr:lamin tail domain-containing protein [Deltaproteobacteria bacterium]
MARARSWSALWFTLSASCGSPGARLGETERGLLGDGLVVSTVFGGGGQAGAPYRNDFIELFNRSEQPVSLTGLSVQYGGAAGVFGASAANVLVLPTTTVAAGGHYLISLGSSGSNGLPLPTPDLVRSVDMASASGKVAIARVTVSLACGSTSRCPTADVVDMVGYGTATDFEGTHAAPAISVTSSLVRKGSGCVDTGSSRDDFLVASPVAEPRKSSTAPSRCSELDAGVGDTGSSTVADASPFDAASADALDAGTATIADAGDLLDASAPDAEPALDSGLGLDGSSTVADAAVPDSGDSPDGGAGFGQGLVISEVYGGGGNSGAVLTHDFVELFNPTSEAVSLAGLSVQYGSASGNFANPTSSGTSGSGLTVLPDFMLEPGRFFLVRMASGGAVGATLTSYDFEGISNLSASNGKVALARMTSSLGCGATPCDRAGIVDMVGFGSATDFEGAAAPRLGAATSAQRKSDGCVDTDDNSADFEEAPPTPRHNGSPAWVCGAPRPDAGSLDATLADSGPRDSARPEAGSRDSGQGPDASAALPDAGSPDAELTDGAVSSDGALSDSGSSRELEPTDDSGCSCKAGGAASAQGPMFLLVGLALVGGRSQRRQSRTSQRAIRWRR